MHTRIGNPVNKTRAFTLIELLVVVAIIALLISILLPSLNAARKQAKAVACATNVRQVGTAVAIYLNTNRDTYPASYIYANGPGGEYDVNDQPANKQYGYVHWSWYLYEGGEVGDNSFTCPDVRTDGGHPRTNPGYDAANWESEQVDDHGAKGADSAGVEDHQAPRMALTANAALIPRNKFTLGMVAGQERRNRFVKSSEIQTSRRVVLATEFSDNLRLISESKGAGLLVKSHRPVNPFFAKAYGTDEYAIPERQSYPPFLYCPPEETNKPIDERKWGLRTRSALKEIDDLWSQKSLSELNAVGRHHPGGDKVVEGTANFLFVDGGVERTTASNTLKDRLWGEKYYSLTGNSAVDYGH